MYQFLIATFCLFSRRARKIRRVMEPSDPHEVWMVIWDRYDPIIDLAMIAAFIWIVAWMSRFA